MLLTEAMVGAVVVHVPPRVVSARVMVLPIHTVDGPVIGPVAGVRVTVTNCVSRALPQILVTSYVMIAVPADTPKTDPVVAFTLATAGLPLVHVPPVVLLVRVAEAPVHKLRVPPIPSTTGVVSTVMDCVSARGPQAFRMV